MAKKSTILPELLAPAGDWECARAAVENGADAIYFGLERFNARMRAQNFTQADLPALMEFLHRRGVKGYVTFNTLVFDDEMPAALESLRLIIQSGVDAAIVQDIGICRLIRQLSPDFPIHASTQMTITSKAGLEFAKTLDCQLVVLARECSIQEIEAMRQSELSMPLEVFVHGALCVAYSGQCLTSEALGGRSANRGECAQACRLPYDLICDGENVPLEGRKYLLSPQDLAGLEVLPDLVRSGVASLKIEGRLKSPEYVASITRVYRQALDQLQASTEGKILSEAARYEMEMAFSRGLYTGWFRGIDNQKLVHAHFGKKRGVFLGEVKQIREQTVLINLANPLKPGDGIVFDGGKSESGEEGGRIYEVRTTAEGTWLHFGHGDIDWQRIQIGDRIWKTSDPVLERALRQSFSKETPQFQRPICMEVHGQEGSPMTLVAYDDEGHAAKAQSKSLLATAEKQPLTLERLREQLGRLGGTPFRLEDLNSQMGPGLILPVSELNQLKRDIVEALNALRAKPKRWQMNTNISLKTLRNPNHKSQGVASELIVLVRSMEQLQAALETGLQRIYCEMEDPQKYQEVMQKARLFRRPNAPSPTIFVAPPRISKSGEERILKLMRASGADGYLVRNYDHLKWFAGEKCVGDYSLNVANALAAEYFMTNFSLERLTASYDLNVQQLGALLKSAPPEWFEVTIHQHMPMFHMEHCVFCAFLSEGTDYTNCGRPCDKHVVKLRDRVGSEHILKADAGCRNTLFNAKAQTGAEAVSRLQAAGVRKFRIEFLDESAALTRQLIERYRELLSGEISGSHLWQEFRLKNELGVTRGQMN